MEAGSEETKPVPVPVPVAEPAPEPDEDVPANVVGPGSFICPHCGEVVNHSYKAGVEVACPSCGERSIVPAEGEDAEKATPPAE